MEAWELNRERAWWKEASVYQIYPASFYDSNGDGFGDINGIVEKLDYLLLLGVDVVWLCPVYESPQADMGYDISNYRAIDPRYGTMDDIDTLLSGLHQRNMKLVMDLVVNHTSDMHDWFKESRSSLDNPKRDWYIWAKPRFDASGARLSPNNWASIFGGSAWSYDELTGEYYLHLFCPEQPDLNWENPAVVREVEGIMRFWLAKGVDGFRMDVINLISKVPGFPDAPITVEGQEFQPAYMHYACGPRLHEHLRALRRILDEYDAFAVGEMPWVKNEGQVLDVVRATRKELNMIFQFDIVDIDNGPSGKFARHEWGLLELKRIVEKWQTLMFQRGGWNALFLENHDQPRSVSRFASDDPRYRAYAAKMLATFIALQSGTLFIYQGQELGMANIPKDWDIKEYKDVETQNMWRSAMGELVKDENKKREYLRQVQLKARDNGRTPVQWTSNAQAGFTSSTPWMRVNDDYPTWNAEAQVTQSDSVFVYWQNLLKLRRLNADIFVYGSFELVDRDHGDVFCYRRAHGEGCSVVVLNFSVGTVDWTIPKALVGLLAYRGPLVHNYTDARRVNDGTLSLRPFEALVWVGEEFKTHL
ncbi:glycoside hydrolase family 13 protein [Melanomma pulvis-pyrius CBS 109.77]|uniref:Glycoside hydrolase family 13 protein n=1 Tax=Melanomma pulvis-pyrius CBS 109.77 TaxID=1314802 RepID=A0A6A6X7J4_9PLEO|nr:glycoside hydrolase family 13 protein [Melanomma pulvis-pyrius CBS 109.77]